MPTTDVDVDAPPIKGFVILVPILKFGLTQGGSTVGLAILGLLSALAGAIPAILNIFAKHSVATPIVTALAPVVPQAMAAAQAITVAPDGATKAAIATSVLAALVQAGKIVSTGGQLHTMQEFEAALPVIQQLFTDVMNVVKPAAATIGDATQVAS